MVSILIRVVPDNEDSTTVLTILKICVFVDERDWIVILSFVLKSVSNALFGVLTIKYELPDNEESTTELFDPYKRWIVSVARLISAVKLAEIVDSVTPDWVIYITCGS